MIRTNSFTTRIVISITLISLSIYLFLISYKEFTKINLDNAIIIEDMNINYFDKDTFQKYYEKIDIQNLTDSQLNEENLDIIHDNEVDNENLIVENNLEEDNRALNFENKKNELFKVDQYVKIKVLEGDNFAKILRKGGLKGRDVDELIINGNEFYDFSKIYLGDIIKIFTYYENNLLNEFKLIYRFSKTQELFVNMMMVVLFMKLIKFLQLKKRYLPQVPLNQVFIIL